MRAKTSGTRVALAPGKSTRIVWPGKQAAATAIARDRIVAPGKRSVTQRLTPPNKR